MSATSTLALGLILTVGAARAEEGRPASARAEAAVRPVLNDASFPWYDPASARVKPLLPWLDLNLNVHWISDIFQAIGRKLSFLGRWLRWLNFWRIPYIGGVGDLIAIGLVMLVLTLVLVVLLELLRRYRPSKDDAAARIAAERGGRAARIEGLPVEVAFDATDPLTEARRRRDQGDYAGAVVYLFAHQLLTLDRLQKLRLVPGRTARQLVRSVADRPLRRCVDPTLRLFEAVYYGHRDPSRDEIEVAWSLALEFEQIVAPGEPS